jgi:hypothetical protein
MGGPPQTLLPFLEERPRLHPVRFGGRGLYFTSPPPLAILHPLSGQERFLHRSRCGSPLFQGGHRGSSTLSSASMLHQSHLSRSEKERGYAPHFELKEADCGAPQHPFRMESVEDVHHALRLGDWVASIDLRDAYFHVPLHHSTKKYMCFGWRGRLYRFCVLPFGLSPAAKVFTALTRIIKVHSRLGHRGRGGPQPSSPSSVLGRPARGILIYSLVTFLPVSACRPHKGGISAFVSGSSLVGIEAPPTGLPLAIRPCF